MRVFLNRFWHFLGSYGLAAVLLVLLAVLTFFGTIEQGRSTLYDVQTRYFGSYYTVHWIGDLPLLLPGGYLLMGALFVNLIVGGLVRIRRDATHLGVFIIHIGIALLLLGGFVGNANSHRGTTSISEVGYQPPRGWPNPPNTTQKFTSTHDWEVAIIRSNADGSTTEFAVPQDEFDRVDEESTLRVKHPDVPFDLVLSEYHRHADLEQVEGGSAAAYRLIGREPVTKDSGPINIPGLEARVVEHASGREHAAPLHGGHVNLLRFSIGGQHWRIELQKHYWLLPFRVRLDRFVHEYHPGTRMPRRFSSFIDVIENGDGESSTSRVHITMNEPLRHGPYTLYQTSWGPQDKRPHKHYYSVLEVVKSPGRVWVLGPIFACTVIGLGLLIHFLWKLYLYLKREARKRSREAVSA